MHFCHFPSLRHSSIVFSSFPARAFAAIVKDFGNFFSNNSTVRSSGEETTTARWRRSCQEGFKGKFKGNLRMLTRQLVRIITNRRIMSGSALERIIANNRIAEQTLEALKREVSLVKQKRRRSSKFLTKSYTTCSSQPSRMNTSVGR